MTPTEVAAIISALGLGAAVPKIVDHFLAWRSGRAERDRDRTSYLVRRAEDAEADRERAELDAEREAADRRAAQEETARYRRALIEQGLDPDTLKPF